jgi:hypothetical protein
MDVQETASFLPYTKESFGGLSRENFLKDLKALSNTFCGGETPKEGGEGGSEDAPSDQAPEGGDGGNVTSGSLLNRYCGQLESLWGVQACAKFSVSGRQLKVELSAAREKNINTKFLLDMVKMFPGSGLPFLETEAADLTLVANFDANLVLVADFSGSAVKVSLDPSSTFKVSVTARITGDIAANIGALSIRLSNVDASLRGTLTLSPSGFRISGSGSFSGKITISGEPICQLKSQINSLRSYFLGQQPESTVGSCAATLVDKITDKLLNSTSLDFWSNGALVLAQWQQGFTNLLNRLFSDRGILGRLALPLVQKVFEKFLIESALAEPLGADYMRKLSLGLTNLTAHFLFDRNVTMEPTLIEEGVLRGVTWLLCKLLKPISCPPVPTVGSDFYDWPMRLGRHKYKQLTSLDFTLGKHGIAGLSMTCPLYIGMKYEFKFNIRFSKVKGLAIQFNNTDIFDASVRFGVGQVPADSGGGAPAQDAPSPSDESAPPPDGGSEPAGDGEQPSGSSEDFPVEERADEDSGGKRYILEGDEEAPEDTGDAPVDGGDAPATNSTGADIVAAKCQAVGILGFLGARVKLNDESGFEGRLRIWWDTKLRAEVTFNAALTGRIELGFAGLLQKLLKEAPDAIEALPHFAMEISMTWNYTLFKPVTAPQFRVTDGTMCIGRILGKFLKQIGDRVGKVIKPLEPILGKDGILMRKLPATKFIFGRALTVLEFIQEIAKIWCNGSCKSIGGIETIKQFIRIYQLIKDIVALTMVDDENGCGFIQRFNDFRANFGKDKPDAEVEPGTNGDGEDKVEDAGYSYDEEVKRRANQMWYECRTEPGGIKWLLNAKQLPGKIVGLLLGQDFAIVRINIPKLLVTAYARWSAYVWAVPPVYLGVEATVSFSAEFAFALTTKGIRKALESGHVGQLLGSLEIIAKNEDGSIHWPVQGSVRLSGFVGIDIWIFNGEAHVFIELQGAVRVANVNDAETVSFDEFWHSFPSSLVIRLRLIAGVGIRIRACINLGFKKWCWTIVSWDGSIPVWTYESKPKVPGPVASAGGDVDAGVVNDGDAGNEVANSISSTTLDGALRDLQRSHKSGLNVRPTEFARTQNLPRFVLLASEDKSRRSIGYYSSTRTPLSGAMPRLRDTPNNRPVNFFGSSGSTPYAVQVHDLSTMVNAGHPNAALELQQGSFGVSEYAISRESVQAGIPTNGIQTNNQCFNLKLVKPNIATGFKFTGAPCPTMIETEVLNNVSLSGEPDHYQSHPISVTGNASVIRSDVLASHYLVSSKAIIGDGGKLNVNWDGNPWNVQVFSHPQNDSHLEVTDTHYTSFTEMRGGLGEDFFRAPSVDLLGGAVYWDGDGSWNKMEVVLPNPGTFVTSTATTKTVAYRGRNAITHKNIATRVYKVMGSADGPSHLTMAPIEEHGEVEIQMIGTASAELTTQITGCDGQALLRVKLDSSGSHTVYIGSNNQISDFKCAVHILGDVTADQTATVVIQAREDPRSLSWYVSDGVMYLFDAKSSKDYFHLTWENIDRVIIEFPNAAPVETKVVLGTHETEYHLNYPEEPEHTSQSELTICRSTNAILVTGKVDVFVGPHRDICNVAFDNTNINSFVSPFDQIKSLIAIAGPSLSSPSDAVRVFFDSKSNGSQHYKLDDTCFTGFDKFGEMLPLATSPSAWMCQQMSFYGLSCSRMDECHITYSGKLHFSVKTGLGHDTFKAKDSKASVDVRLGGGEDLVVWGNTASPAIFDLGTGTDRLILQSPVSAVKALLGEDPDLDQVIVYGAEFRPSVLRTQVGPIGPVADTDILLLEQYYKRDRVYVRRMNSAEDEKRKRMVLATQDVEIQVNGLGKFVKYDLIDDTNYLVTDAGEHSTLVLNGLATSDNETDLPAQRWHVQLSMPSYVTPTEVVVYSELNVQSQITMNVPASTKRDQSIHYLLEMRKTEPSGYGKINIGGVDLEVFNPNRFHFNSPVTHVDVHMKSAPADTDLRFTMPAHPATIDPAAKRSEVTLCQSSAGILVEGAANVVVGPNGGICDSYLDGSLNENYVNAMDGLRSMVVVSGSTADASPRVPVAFQSSSAFAQGYSVDATCMFPLDMSGSNAPRQVEVQPSSWMCEQFQSVGVECATRMCLMTYTGRIHFVVQTGAGADVFRGANSLATVDVALGQGEDIVDWSTTAASAAFDLGLGADNITLQVPLSQTVVSLGDDQDQDNVKFIGTEYRTSILKNRLVPVGPRGPADYIEINLERPGDTVHNSRTPSSALLNPLSTAVFDLEGNQRQIFYTAVDATSYRIINAGHDSSFTLSGLPGTGNSANAVRWNTTFDLPTVAPTTRVAVHSGQNSENLVSMNVPSDLSGETDESYVFKMNQLPTPGFGKWLVAGLDVELRYPARMILNSLISPVDVHMQSTPGDGDLLLTMPPQSRRRSIVTLCRSSAGILVTGSVNVTVGLDHPACETADEFSGALDHFQSMVVVKGAIDDEMAVPIVVHSTQPRPQRYGMDPMCMFPLDDTLQAESLTTQPSQWICDRFSDAGVACDRKCHLRYSNSARFSVHTSSGPDAFVAKHVLAPVDLNTGDGADTVDWEGHASTSRLMTGGGPDRVVIRAPIADSFVDLGNDDDPDHVEIIGSELHPNIDDTKVGPLGPNGQPFFLRLARQLRGDRLWITRSGVPSRKRSVEAVSTVNVNIEGRGRYVRYDVADDTQYLVANAGESCTVVFNGRPVRDGDQPAHNWEVVLNMPSLAAPTEVAFYATQNSESLLTFNVPPGASPSVLYQMEMKKTPSAGYGKVNIAGLDLEMLNPSHIAINAATAPMKATIEAIPGNADLMLHMRPPLSSVTIGELSQDTFIINATVAISSANIATSQTIYLAGSRTQASIAALNGTGSYIDGCINVAGVSPATTRPAASTWLQTQLTAFGLPATVQSFNCSVFTQGVAAISLASIEEMTVSEMAGNNKKLTIGKGKAILKDTKTIWSSVSINRNTIDINRIYTVTVDPDQRVDVQTPFTPTGPTNFAVTCDKSQGVQPIFDFSCTFRTSTYMSRKEMRWGCDSTGVICVPDDRKVRFDFTRTFDNAGNGSISSTPAPVDLTFTLAADRASQTEKNVTLVNFIPSGVILQPLDETWALTASATGAVSRTMNFDMVEGDFRIEAIAESQNGVRLKFRDRASASINSKSDVVLQTRGSNIEFDPSYHTITRVRSSEESTSLCMRPKNQCSSTAWLRHEIHSKAQCATPEQINTCKSDTGLEVETDAPMICDADGNKGSWSIRVLLSGTSAEQISLPYIPFKIWVIVCYAFVVVLSVAGWAWRHNVMDLGWSPFVLTAAIQSVVPQTVDITATALIGSVAEAVSALAGCPGSLSATPNHTLAFGIVALIVAVLLIVSAVLRWRLDVSESLRNRIIGYAGNALLGVAVFFLVPLVVTRWTVSGGFSFIAAFGAILICLVFFIEDFVSSGPDDGGSILDRIRARWNCLLPHQKFQMLYNIIAILLFVIVAVTGSLVSIPAIPIGMIGVSIIVSHGLRGFAYWKFVKGSNMLKKIVAMVLIAVATVPGLAFCLTIYANAPVNMIVVFFVWVVSTIVVGVILAINWSALPSVGSGILERIPRPSFGRGKKALNTNFDESDNSAYVPPSIGAGDASYALLGDVDERPSGSSSAPPPPPPPSGGFKRTGRPVESDVNEFAPRSSVRMSRRVQESQDDSRYQELEETITDAEQSFSSSPPRKGLPPPPPPAPRGGLPPPGGSGEGDSDDETIEEYDAVTLDGSESSSYRSSVGSSASLLRDNRDSRRLSTRPPSSAFVPPPTSIPPPPSAGPTPHQSILAPPAPTTIPPPPSAGPTPHQSMMAPPPPTTVPPPPTLSRSNTSSLFDIEPTAAAAPVPAPAYMDALIDQLFASEAEVAARPNSLTPGDSAFVNKLRSRIFGEEDKKKDKKDKKDEKKRRQEARKTILNLDVAELQLQEKELALIRAVQQMVGTDDSVTL